MTVQKDFAFLIFIVAALVAVTGASIKAVAQENTLSVFNPDEEKRIKQLVLEAILQKPEILREANRILNKKEQEAKPLLSKPFLTNGKMS